jgi:hypothetical protein
MAQEIRDVVFNIQVRTEDGSVKIEGLTKGFVKAETAFKKMQTTLKSTNEQIKGAGISTGLANTAILEFGRTVSDAPYGIQGMGNNISQLVSILGQMSQAAKQGGNVIKSLKEAFIGPLGVVVAVQAAVAAIEYFSRTLKDGTDVLTELDVAVAKSAISLKLVKSALDDESTSLKEKEEIVQALNREYPEWNVQLEASGNISSENKEKIDAEIDALQRLAKAKAYQTMLEEAYAREVKMTSDFSREQGTTMSRVKNILAGFGNETAGMTIRFKAFQAGMKDVTEEIEFLEKGVQGEGLVDLLLGTSKKKEPKEKVERRKRVKELVLETYDIATVEAENRRKEIEKKFKSLGLDVSSLILGGEEGKKALGEGILGLIGGLEETGYSDRTKETMRKAVFAEDILDGAEALLDATSSLVESQAERDLAIEQNKTNALNDQLKQRLANEELSAQERDKINQQISRNESQLVSRENEINKRRFNQQKALQLASATAELYRTAFLAYGSQLVIGDPTSPVRAQIAQGVALATGLASIANIARQQFVGKALPTPNLVAQGSGPAESQGPAFNIVGASGQSQLAQLISGQTGQPIKAYVVAGEVTTAQSLERNKIAEASI